jgi:mycothiol synthase
MSTEMIPVAREFQGEADLAPLVAMLKAVADEDKDGMTVSADDIRFEWVDEEPGWVRHLQVWEAGDRFVASFGSWYQPEDPVARSYGELEIHPAWREPVFVDEVIQTNVDAVAELVDRAAEYRIAAAGSQEWKRAGFERAGFMAERHFFRMSAPLGDDLPEPTIADGFRIRPLEGEAEAEAWIATHNAGFADHYDPPAFSLDDKRTQMRAPGYFPAADLVLVDSADRFIGIGHNRIERLDAGVDKGWVQYVAVLPEYRKRGLGRALLLASMQALKAAGFNKAHLSADSENQSGALQLYTSAGFSIDNRMIVYMRAIDPA